MAVNAQQAETMEFQTEVNQLLGLMIHSLYSNKEIFLRELISNASDAADKLRFEALGNDALYEGDTDLCIRVSYDKEANTVTIRDNGIGMTRDEVIEHIGTIAKSGTREFFGKLTGDDAKDSQLIGQFGVGFYSAFIVADRVTLTTRKAGADADDGVRWESEGKGSFDLETVSLKDRGTSIVLHLREDEDEFLDGYRLRTVIKKFSDHISLPIYMQKEALGSDKKEESTDEPEDEVVNSASALWVRPRNEISDEEYNQLYKDVSHDFEDPLAHVHSRVEGNNEYTSLLYVPARAPFDLWDSQRQQGIKLYVKRIYIMDDTENQLMPRYLRFIRGVIDSDDLPLNVSREILQKNRTIDTMRGGSVKKVLGLLEGLAKNDEEKYSTFWKEFGRVMKEGPAEDHANRERIAKLFRFSSTHDDVEEQKISLEDYVSRMGEDQDVIYYVTAESFAAAKNSPHLEVLRDKGVEVLLLTDRVDEWLTSHLTEFDGKKLQSVARGAMDVSKEDADKANEEHKDLVERIKEALGDQVESVCISQRLSSSPACLVAGDNDMGANMERIMRAVGQEVPESKRIFEINPEHLLVQRLEKESSETRFRDLTQILMDQAILSEGGQLDDPANYVHRLNDLIIDLSS